LTTSGIAESDEVESKVGGLKLVIEFKGTAPLVFVFFDVRFPHLFGNDCLERKELVETEDFFLPFPIGDPLKDEAFGGPSSRRRRRRGRRLADLRPP
jgi:hypothetical protein